MEPIISVVMSVYNAESHLRSAVKSIIDQTFADFEFIIIEDGSTDNSKTILQELANEDKRIKIIFKEYNEGTEGFIKNLNTGLQLAKGKYIARMDADDLSLPERFEKQLRFLEENQDVFMVGSNLELIDENNHPLRIMTAPENDAEIRSQMLKKITMYHPVIMFRNEEKLFYRGKMRYCEDYDLYLRIMTGALKMANINQVLLQYRVLENSMSRKQDKVIKNLFINQAKIFFKERLEGGKDSYDSFDPNQFLNIYKNPSKELIVKAIQVSKKYYDYTGFEKLMKMYKDLYPKDYYYLSQRLLLAFGEATFLKLSRILNL